MHNIVLIGAGGTGMSGLAMMLFDIGYKNIVCINNIQTDLTDRLVRHGLKVIIGHGIYQVDIHDFVIYSDVQAIIDGPEITQSRLYQQSPTKKHFHICVTYNQFIAEISKRFTTVSVSGSNGKTSTTGMLIWALSQSENSQFGLGIVGGLMPNFDQQGYALTSETSIRSDIHHLFEHIFNQKHQLDYSLVKKYIFVIEACEYKDHFLLYDSDYTLITNIQRDHVDYFKTRESYQEAFVHMISNTRNKVILTPTATQVLSSYDLPHCVVSDSFPFSTDYLIGSYSHSNASMVAHLFEELHIPSGNLPSILSQFRGVGRRMELIGKINDNLVYSDYSHHAPAIAGNMQALKTQFPDKKICVIFQPHQAQRVLVGRDDFAAALKSADTTVIYKLYTARENFSELQSSFPRLHGLENFDQLGEEFATELKGEYILDMDDLSQRLSGLGDDYIFVIFSAGDLDEKMRKVVD